MSDDFPQMKPEVWRVTIVARQYIDAVKRGTQAGPSREAAEKRIAQYKRELEQEVAAVLGVEVNPAIPKSAMQQVEEHYGAEKAQEFRTAYIGAIKKAEEIWKMGSTVSSASSLH
jgi:hypothetical protein